MNLRTAAQQALEALESCWEKGLTRKNWKQAEEAITALRTALEEPEQWHCDDCGGTDPECPNKPQRTEPEQEPVACVTGAYAGHFTVVPTNAALVLTTGMALYTHPPERKPLTDEEIWRKYQGLWPFHPAAEPKLAADIAAFARAIERAHGIGGEA